jgi:hypothetical protein
LAAQDDADNEHHGVRESSGERRPPIIDRQDALWAQSPTSDRENAAPTALVVARLRRRPVWTSAPVAARLAVHLSTVRPQFNPRAITGAPSPALWRQHGREHQAVHDHPWLVSSVPARGAAALAHDDGEEDVYEECGQHNI